MAEVVSTRAITVKRVLLLSALDVALQAASSRKDGFTEFGKLWLWIDEQGRLHFATRNFNFQVHLTLDLQLQDGPTPYLVVPMAQTLYETLRRLDNEDVTLLLYGGSLLLETEQGRYKLCAIPRDHIDMLSEDGITLGFVKAGRLHKALESLLTIIQKAPDWLKGISFVAIDEELALEGTDSVTAGRAALPLDRVEARDPVGVHVAAEGCVALAKVLARAVADVGEDYDVQVCYKPFGLLIFRVGPIVVTMPKCYLSLPDFSPVFDNLLQAKQRLVFRTDMLWQTLRRARAIGVNDNGFIACRLEPQEESVRFVVEGPDSEAVMTETVSCEGWCVRTIRFNLSVLRTITEAADDTLTLLVPNEGAVFFESESLLGAFMPLVSV